MHSGMHSGYMNDLQHEERLIQEANRRFEPVPLFRATAVTPGSKLSKKPAASASELGIPVPEGMREVACQACGGKGWDPGSLDPFGELCPDCKGSKVELIAVGTIQPKEKIA